MRYLIKLNKKGVPVPGSLVYNTSYPQKGRWMEIETLDKDEEGHCIQPPKPANYYQKLKFYYLVDDCCNPIAGSNVNAYCTPTGNYFEFFPACLIKNCPLPLGINVTVGPAILCYGGSTTYTVTGHDGYPPYTGTGTFSAVAGTYVVTITDSHNNTASAAVTIPAATATQLIASLRSYDIDCYGNDNGSIITTVIGGTAPYQYAITAIDSVPVTNPVYQPSGIFDGLSPAEYQITVMDDNGCVRVVSAEINEPTELAVSVSSTNILCHGELSGTATSVVTGGTPPYSYLWTGLTFHSTQHNLSNLPPGTYNLTVTDSKNCTVSDSVTITEPAEFIVTESHENVYCYGANDGSITLSVTGGVAPYEYLWNTGDTTDVLTDVGPGRYRVTVTDANGCVKQLNVLITEPAELVVYETHVSPLCYGDANGSITLSVSGGVAPYTYLWAGTGVNPTSQNQTGLESGTYSVIVTDDNGCQVSLSNISLEVDPITADIDYDVIYVFGATTTVTISSVSGGTAPYQYSLDGGPYQLSNIFTDVLAGTYTITIKDFNNCTQSFILTIPEAEHSTKCADCAPLEFDNTSASYVGVLSVGNLTSSSCTIGDYVIDWYLDSTTNPIEFTSGEGSDPDIVQQHPFTGTSARPSVAGTWIPVIRYAYINGVQYYSDYILGEEYSPDLATCLDPIVVENLTCTNGTSSGDYAHIIEYTNTNQDINDRNRTFIFELNSDGSTNYFAWRFYAYDIGDRIKITYVSGASEDILYDIVVGYDGPSSNFTVTPKILYGLVIAEVLDLSSVIYDPGDYLRIDITASYNDPANTNTNWLFKAVCLETFDCTWTPNEPDMCTTAMTYNEATCKYDLRIDYPTFTENNTTDIYRYLVDTGYGTYQVSHPPSSTEPYVVFSLPSISTCTYNSFGSGACIRPSNGNVSVSKSGNIFTIQFADTTDYNYYKAYYQTVYNYNALTYVNDNTDINYYKFIRVRVIAGISNCGDAGTPIEIYFHQSSPVVLNDGTNTITITVQNANYGLNFTACEGCDTSANMFYIGVVNSTINGANFSNQISNVICSSQGIYYYIELPATEFYLQNYFATYVPYSSPVCDVPNGWCSVTEYNETRFEYSDYSVFVKIDDPLDVINNFTISVFPNQRLCRTDGPVLYKIEDGVVSVPLSCATLGWRALTLACEPETQFNILRIITGLSSPMHVWYDESLNRVWVSDGDNFIKGNVYWFNPATAMTEADMVYYPGIKANALYFSYIDEQYRRIYFWGTDTNNRTQPGGSGVITGLVVYNMDTNTHYQVSYGSNTQYRRMINFVSGGYLYGNDDLNSRLVIFDRTANPITILSYITFTATGAPSYFSNSTGNWITVGNMIWIVAGVGSFNGGNVGIFNQNLIYQGSITLPGRAVVPSYNNGSNAYWQSSFYDEQYNKFYVNDLGSNNLYIISVNSTYNGGTVIETRSLTYMTENRNYVFGNLSVDPVSNKLYMAFQQFDQIGVSPITNKSYEIDRTTTQFVRLFKNIGIPYIKIVNDGTYINSLMGAAAGNVMWGTGYPSASYTDGTITIYNNTTPGDNSGIVDVLTEEEYIIFNGEKTGEIKLNFPTLNGQPNPDYIPPYLDTTECPITYTRKCPTSTSKPFPTGCYWEFNIVNTVKLNPEIAYIKVNLLNVGNSVITSTTINAPFTTNYYSGTLTSGLGTYHISIEYYDVDDVLIPCTT